MKTRHRSRHGKAELPHAPRSTPRRVRHGRRGSLSAVQALGLKPNLGRVLPQPD